MLYGIGVIIILLSLAFVGGSPVVPMAMVVIGMTLTKLGRRYANGKGKATRI